MKACLHVWEQELADDHDRDFILNGIKHGFSLIDGSPDLISPASVPNHPSANHPRTSDRVENRIKEEIQDGNYIISPECPKVVSALAAIEKPDGDVRLIHDLSRPADHSVNDYASKDECQYTSVEEALALCSPNGYLCKVDLKWAYRSFAIPPAQHTITGLQWTFKGDNHPTFLMDGKLPFGARKSPAIYNRITQAIQRMMRKRGFKVCAYLDDFICCAEDKLSCTLAFNSLIALLRQLGLRINWKKVVDPCQCLTYLGLEIDTVKGTLKLDKQKAIHIQEDLNEYLTKKRLSKRQLQSLAGKLNWAAHVHPWGKAFMASFFHSIGLLVKPHHKFLVNSTMIKDMHWWLACLSQDLHIRNIWDFRAQVIITTDSSSVGAGAFCLNDGDICYTNWILDKPELANAHINIKELATVLFCLVRWAPAYPGCHFNIHSDNFMTTCAVNNRYSPNSMASSILRRIADLVVAHNISITAHYIKGELNHIADALSRLHSPGQLLRLSALLHQFHGDNLCFYLLANHMSLPSLEFLLPSLQKLLLTYKSWMQRSGG